MAQNKSSNAGASLPVPDPTPLMELSTAYWSSQTLFTAIRLGLFEQLSEGPRSLESIASGLIAHPRSTRLFLKACVGLGLLQEDTAGFKNSAMSQLYLVPGTDFYLGNSFRYSDDLYGTWGQLQRAVIQGKPAIPPESYLGRDKEQTKHFVYGMHNRALSIGKTMINLVDLTGRRQLLDVGGGPGTFSALFVDRYQSLHAKVLDLPDIVAIADEIIESMGAGSKVKTIPGDYMETAFPDGNDVVLISGVFHRETEQTCRELIRRSVESLSDNGMLVISDVFTDSGNCSPLFSTLFGLNMLLTAENGGVHADSDVVSWMTQAGLTETDVSPFPPPMPHRIVIGYKI
jgi:3-hydroxy-5-methyl-1-naphthoate 3-O-methyltransferase